MAFSFSTKITLADILEDNIFRGVFEKFADGKELGSTLQCYQRIEESKQQMENFSKNAKEIISTYFMEDSLLKITIVPQELASVLVNSAKSDEISSAIFDRVHSVLATRLKFLVDEFSSQRAFQDLAGWICCCEETYSIQDTMPSALFVQKLPVLRRT